MTWYEVGSHGREISCAALVILPRGWARSMCLVRAGTNAYFCVFLFLKWLNPFIDPFIGRALNALFQSSWVGVCTRLNLCVEMYFA